jgi:hypothetical protein
VDKPLQRLLMSVKASLRVQSLYHRDPRAGVYLARLDQITPTRSSKPLVPLADANFNIDLAKKPGTYPRLEPAPTVSSFFKHGNHATCACVKNWQQIREAEPVNIDPQEQVPIAARLPVIKKGDKL